MLERPFYFVRHGETDWNRDRLIMGRRDVPLNGTGRSQAVDAARALLGVPIAAVWSSPLIRARETAEAIAFRVGLPVALEEGLMERGWGALEGRPVAERPSRRYVPSGGESLEVFARRVLAAADRIALGPSPAVIVSHSGVYRVLCTRLALGDCEGPVPNGVPLMIEPRPGGWRVRALTDDVPGTEGGPAEAP
jgi:probable phosphoglycerate mutase